MFAAPPVTVPTPVVSVPEPSTWAIDPEIPIPKEPACDTPAKAIVANIVNISFFHCFP